MKGGLERGRGQVEVLEEGAGSPASSELGAEEKCPEELADLPALPV